MQGNIKLEESEIKRIVKQDRYCYFAPGSLRWIETSFRHTSRIRNMRY